MTESDTRARALWHSCRSSSTRSAVAPTVVTNPRWRDLAVRLWVTDLVAVAVAVAVAYLVRFDVHRPARPSPASSRRRTSPCPSCSPSRGSRPWRVGRTRDRRVLGSGPTEFSRVFDVTWRLFAAVAVVAYLLRMEIGRGLPRLRRAARARPAPRRPGVVAALAAHAAATRASTSPASSSSGTGTRRPALIGELHQNPRAGYAVLGVCVPTGEIIAGRAHRRRPGARRRWTVRPRSPSAVGASAVAVTGADAITADTVRRLGWDLEGKGIDLALTLALVDVAGPRVLMQPVSGLPLMYVDEARFTGGKYIAKSLFDWALAALDHARAAPGARGRRDPRPRHQPRPGALPAGAHRQGRQAVPDLQVPHHGRRRGQAARRGARRPGRRRPSACSTSRRTTRA